jgi:hypothetical protein
LVYDLSAFSARAERRRTFMTLAALIAAIFAYFQQIAEYFFSFPLP